MNLINMTQLQPKLIEGIYEVCIGIREPIPMIQYWEQFGYRIGQVGELPEEAVNTSTQRVSVNYIASISNSRQSALHALHPKTDGTGVHPLSKNA